MESEMLAFAPDELRGYASPVVDVMDKVWSGPVPSCQTWQTTFRPTIRNQAGLPNSSLPLSQPFRSSSTNVDLEVLSLAATIVVLRSPHWWYSPWYDHRLSSATVRVL